MDKEVDAYFSSVPEARQEIVNALHALILELYPQARVDMSYRMPAYRIGQGWVALANQKRYVSLYTCGAHHLERFRGQVASRRESLPMNTKRRGFESLNTSL